MINFIRNIPWKEILIIGLLAALGIGAVVGIGAAVTNKTKTVSSLEFARGEVDENGVYVKSETSIYTKNLIECQGLEITPDFEATGTYQVFYYDTNKLFLGASPVLNASSGGVYKKGQDFPYAKYCRIMITPEVPVDDDGYVEEDYKIKFYEVVGIADKFTITVNKEQKAVKEQNLFEVCVDTNMIAKGYAPSVDFETNLFKEIVAEGYNYCSVLNLDNVNSLRLFYEKDPGNLSYFFYTKGSAFVSEGSVEDVKAGTDYYIDVPEGAYMLCLVYTESNPPAIYRAS